MFKNITLPMINVYLQTFLIYTVNTNVNGNLAHPDYEHLLCTWCPTSSQECITQKSGKAGAHY